MAKQKRPANTGPGWNEGQEPAADTRGRFRGWLGLGIVLLATAFLYAPALSHQFTNWDDDRQVTANPDIRDLSPQGIGKMFSSFYVSLYQPLTSLSWAVEYRLFGLNPRVYHTVNILLHLVNILLVYVFVRSLSAHVGISLVTTALFAVHPLQVEVAAWVSSRSILLSSLFYLGAMIAYIAYAKSGKLRYFALGLVLFVPALLAKTTAATLPLVLMVIDLYLERKVSRQTIWEKIPFFLLSIVFGCITMLARSGVSHLQDFAFKYSLVQRICIVCYSCLWYVGKLVLPVDLSVFYPFPAKPNGWLPIAFYLAPLLLLGLAVGIWYAGRYRRLLAFAALFMLASLVLVVQIVPISELMVCDRYAYLPCIGLFFLAGTLGHRVGLQNPSWRRAMPVGVMLILVALGGLTYQRIGVWRDSLTLWNDFLRRRQDIWVAYLNRGLAEYDEGDRQAAIADFDATLRLNPKADKALNNRAAAYVALGNRPAALRDFDEAIRLNPADSSYVVNRGILKRDMGDFAGAVQDFDTVIELNARNVRALCERADAYRMQGDWTKARVDYDAVLRLDPGHTYAAFLLGAVLVQTGDGQRAVAMLNKALALGCRDPGPAYYLLAQAYQKTGRMDLAKEALRRSQELGYRGPQAPPRQ
ncbi:MAG: tetratricopeptide repeat protein [Planctomycetes bacterium]|nr:tetratricopeptide repeat protein [Planctomycetota bacterium]